jgi:hypothetical protein
VGEIIPFKPPSGTGGAGPEDPMIEHIEKLEGKMDKVEGKLSAIEVTLAEIKGQLSQMPKATDFAKLSAEVAEVKGRVANLPTTWQLMTFTIGSVMAAAGLAFTIARYLKP